MGCKTCPPAAIWKRKEPHGSHETRHVLACYADQPYCYYKSESAIVCTIHTRIVSKYLTALQIWIMAGGHSVPWRQKAPKIILHGCHQLHCECVLATAHVSTSEWALTSPRVCWGQAHNVQSCHGHALNITLCSSQVIKVHTHRQPGPLERQRANTLTDAALLNSIHFCKMRLMLSQH